jgi:hypothetical protein
LRAIDHDVYRGVTVAATECLEFPPLLATTTKPRGTSFLHMANFSHRRETMKEPVWLRTGRRVREHPKTSRGADF